jgi:hypothetical protein
MASRKKPAPKAAPRGAAQTLSGAAPKAKPAAGQGLIPKLPPPAGRQELCGLTATAR